VAIRIYNDDADDMVVSVYDMNVQHSDALITTQRINGFSWIPMTLKADAVGKGDLRLIARTVDPDFHKCGYKEVRAVGNDAAVYISANSRCRKVRRISENLSAQ
jgi:hypothetical protein